MPKDRDRVEVRSEMEALEKSLFLVGLSFTVLLLLACSRPAQTVEWYKAHSDERDQMVNNCVVNGDDTADCRNAKQADYELMGVRAKNGVPIDN